MRIFATSDIHGSRNIIEKLKRIALKTDMLLVCGDIGRKDVPFRSFQEFSRVQKEGAEHLSKTLSEVPIPGRFILGNDDWFEYEGPNYLAGNETVNGLQLVPFEYVLLTPFNTNREVNDNKIRYELEKLQADQNSIVVAHMPPFGAGDILYNGSRCGSRAIRNWIEEVQPKIWLCGHIHEDNSANYIGETLVLNCACEHQKGTLKGWLVDTETLEYKAVVI